ncbi:MAG: ABC transporter substrate-binding protein [Candidatus Saccharibacteria bacterium]|nr:ABC transporter substrate-binding protein [Candidatus Saccharibacteria bacterium]
MNNSFKKMVLLGMSALVLSACNTQTTSSGDADSTANETETTETVSSNGSAVQLEQVDMDDETAWQEEPAYGDTLTMISTSGCTAPIDVALKSGYFEEEGIDVETVASQTSTIDAVGTGQATIGAGHITSSLVPIINGVGAQYLGPMHTGCKALYVAADSDIESAGDMDDMNIGIHGGIGESDHNIALRFLQEEGADPDSVQFTNSDVAATTEAIKSGELDGAIYSENYAAPFVEDGTLKSINSLTFDDAFADEVCCATYVNKEFAQENPVTVKKLTRAIYKANKWAEDDSEGYVDFLYANDLLSGDEQVGFEWIDSLNYHPTEEQMHDTVREITEDYIALGIVDSDVDADTVMEEIWAPTGLSITD